MFLLRFYLWIDGFTIIQKDKEDLEEVSMELELADEDELVPYVFDIPFLTLYIFFRIGMYIGRTLLTSTDTKLATHSSSFPWKRHRLCSPHRPSRLTQTFPS